MVPVGRGIPPLDRQRLVEVACNSCTTSGRGQPAIVATVTLSRGQATVRLERVAHGFVNGSWAYVDTSYGVVLDAAALATSGSFEGWCRRHGQAVVFGADLDVALKKATKLGHAVRISSAPN
jgi:hypothetical protein